MASGRTIWLWFRSWFLPAPPAQRVGFLCSATKPEVADFLTAFEDGLNGGSTHTVPVIPKYADGKYGQGDRTLVALAKQLIEGTDKVDVIAATGGFTSLQAAVQAA